MDSILLGGKKNPIGYIQATRCLQESSILVMLELSTISLVRWEGIYSCFPVPVQERIYNGLICYMGIYLLYVSIVIGKGNTIAIMDIYNVNYQQQSTDYNKQQLSADTRQHAGDTTSKVNSLIFFRRRSE